MKKICMLILFFISTSHIYAYENDIFKLDIPENYKEEIKDTNLHKWTNNNNYISISISDNTKFNYDVSKYTEKDINKQKEYIENNLNTNLKEYNFEVNVTDIKKIKLNNKDSLNYTIYWPSKDAIGYNQYQIGNLFTSSKYILTILISYENNINDEEYNKIISSLIIKDEEIKKENIFDYKKIITIIIIVFAISLAIINFIKKQKKHN